MSFKSKFKGNSIITYLKNVSTRDVINTQNQCQIWIYLGPCYVWCSAGKSCWPLPLTIFINDLPNASEEMVTTALYASDTKVFNCIGSEEDCLALQGTLSNMEHWSKENNNYFNASRCKALNVTRKRKPLCYSYNLDGVHITRVAEEKDLGVTITSSIS